ncbi:MAG: hypothetical protein HY519_00165 [Candidatus Aenigmarchaeota archaeon]|nr:hypothetical protein [Candidatus Aenigmarchaeota archaeon]
MKKIFLTVFAVLLLAGIALANGGFKQSVWNQNGGTVTALMGINLPAFVLEKSVFQGSLLADSSDNVRSGNVYSSIKGKAGSIYQIIGTFSGRITTCQEISNYQTHCFATGMYNGVDSTMEFQARDDGTTRYRIKRNSDNVILARVIDMDGTYNFNAI